MDAFRITAKAIVDGNWHVFSGQVTLIFVIIRYIMSQNVKNTQIDGEITAVNKRVDGVVDTISKNNKHLETISNDFGEMKLTVNTIQVHLENKDGFRDGSKGKKYHQV